MSMSAQQIRTTVSSGVLIQLDHTSAIVTLDTDFTQTDTDALVWLHIVS